MTLTDANWTLCQSEKIKAGLIWIGQVAETTRTLEGARRQGAVGVLVTLMGLVSGEIHLARRLSGNDQWLEVDRCLSMARVMAESNVAHEAAFHISQALSHVTQLGGQAAEALAAPGSVNGKKEQDR